MRPACGALIAHAEMLMPQDIEARYGMVGGNWHHGDLAVEQMLFLRPCAEVAQYAHPGCRAVAGAARAAIPAAAFSGAAGWNAAGAILAEARQMSDPRLHYRTPLLRTPFHPRLARGQCPEPMGRLGWLYHRARPSRRGDGIYRHPQWREPRSMTCARW